MKLPAFMKKNDPHKLTFAILDREADISEVPPASGEEFPLPAWYRRVQEIPLDELSTEDICKACRQQIHHKHVVPIAIKMLETDLLAGEMYDGELLSSLLSAPLDFWLDHSNDREKLKTLIEKVLHLKAVDANIHKDLKELLVKVTLDKPDTPIRTRSKNDAV